MKHWLLGVSISIALGVLVFDWDWVGQHSTALTFLATAAGAAVALFYALLTRRLAQAAKEQADLTRKTFEASNRPYLSLEGQLQMADAFPPNYFSLVAANHGKVPACILNCHEGPPVSGCEPRRRDLPVFLFPGQTIEVVRFAYARAAFSNEERDLTVAITVTYRGHTDTEYYTECLLTAHYRPGGFGHIQTEIRQAT